jgi:hypothetical protein
MFLPLHLLLLITYIVAGSDDQDISLEILKLGKQKFQVK